ncbi:hypothetical protein BGZ83_007239, partial [Gryganskiella cystojenkinii]
MIQKVLPLAYTFSLAIFIYHLSRKPVHLGKYESIAQQTQDAQEQDDHEQQQQQSSQERQQTESSVVHEEHLLQLQYEAQRAKGFSVDLGRLGLTTLQLGLTLFSIVLIHSGKEEIPAKDTAFGDMIQVLSWTFALGLSFVHLMKPKIAFAFWIRPVMDFYYLLEWVLAAIGLVQSGVLMSPLSEWPQWIKMEGFSWLIVTLLLWISSRTIPFQAGPMKYRLSLVKNRETGEMMTFGWVNTLIYLGYSRPLQDIDLPDLELDDQTSFTVRRFANF